MSRRTSTPSARGDREFERQYLRLFESINRNTELQTQALNQLNRTLQDLLQEIRHDREVWRALIASQDMQLRRNRDNESPVTHSPITPYSEENYSPSWAETPNQSPFVSENSITGWEVGSVLSPRTPDSQSSI